MEPNFNLKCGAFSTPFTCELEYRKHVFLTGRWHFSYANQIQKEKHSGNRTGAVLNVFTDFEKEKIMFDAIFPDDVILIIQKTKIKTCDVPGCVASANKIQITAENISFKLI